MSVIKPKLHHVTIKTKRLAEMVEWYGIVLGTDIQFMDAQNAWTTNDEANHRVAFLSSPGLADDPAKTGHTGMHHSAFEYDSFADLFSSYERMRDAGVTPAFCLEHSITISLYYRDPDGNFVELQSDNFGDWSRSSEWMRTSPDFAANPIGVFFDPERVAQAHRAGRDLPALQAAIRQGEFLPAATPDMGLPA